MILSRMTTEKTSEKHAEYEQSKDLEFYRNGSSMVVSLRPWQSSVFTEHDSDQSKAHGSQKAGVWPSERRMVGIVELGSIEQTKIMKSCQCIHGCVDGFQWWWNVCYRWRPCRWPRRHPDELACWRIVSSRSFESLQCSLQLQNVAQEVFNKRERGMGELWLTHVSLERREDEDVERFILEWTNELSHTCTSKTIDVDIAKGHGRRRRRLVDSDFVEVTITGLTTSAMTYLARQRPIIAHGHVHICIRHSMAILQQSGHVAEQCPDRCVASKQDTLVVEQLTSLFLGHG